MARTSSSGLTLVHEQLGARCLSLRVGDVAWDELGDSKSLLQKYKKREGAKVR